jgi:hypothetical protein
MGLYYEDPKQWLLTKDYDEIIAQRIRIILAAAFFALIHALLQ